MPKQRTLKIWDKTLPPPPGQFYPGNYTERPYTDLENEFADLVEATEPQINSLLKQASDAIAAAEKLADKTGVSFYAGVSPLSQSYKADLPKKFQDLDVEILEDVFADCGIPEYEGWQHSAVC